MPRAQSEPYADRRRAASWRHLPERRLHSVKALLHTSHMFEASHDFADQGIKVKARPSIDVPTMVARKAKIVDRSSPAVSGPVPKNKVTMLSKGMAALSARPADGWDVKVGDEVVGGKQVIVARFDSSPLPGVPVDNA